MIKRLTATFAAFALVLAACSGPLALQVTDLQPADGATNVPVDIVLSATFNQAIDTDTLDGAFTLSDGDLTVDGTLAYDAATRTATFEPTAPLAHATTYTATVEGTVATTNGTTLTGDASWSFTTAAPDPAVTSVVVAPATSNLLVGDETTLTATVTTIGGASTTVTWSSSDEGVATVDASGLVTAQGEGTATITATSTFDTDVSGTATVEVTPFAIGGYTIDGPDAPLAVAATAQLTATPFGLVGTPDTSVTWTSDDEDVATVDANGLVTAVAPGVATMTATSVFDPTVTASLDLEVATPLEAVGIIDMGVVVGYIADIDAGTTIDPVLPAPFTGGVAPFTYEVVTPDDAPLDLHGVPPGMSLDLTTGELTGTPTVASFYNFAVEATDAIGQTAIAYGEIEVFLVLEYGSAAYTYDYVAAPTPIVPAADVTVRGNEDPEDLTFTLALVSTSPAGGSISDWSIDADGAITYEVASLPFVWIIEVTVSDASTGASDTFVLTFTTAP